MTHKEIRKQFSILKKITYFDSAALVLKPDCAIDNLLYFYKESPISSRTADTPLGIKVNNTILRVRQKVAKLIDGNENEIIFTSGTTDSLNTFSLMAKQILKKGDVFLISAFNHSSNMLPWIEICKEIGANAFICEDIEANINEKVKFIALSHETNNFKVVLNLDKIYEKAKKVGAFVINDAAQSIAHQKVSLKYADVIAFSTNKLYGPTGMGVLAIKHDLLKKLKPQRFGGGTVNEIKNNQEWSIKETIAAFEPGTQHLAGFFMFEKSLDFLEKVTYKTTQEILHKLSVYLHQKLKNLQNVEVYSNEGDYIALINVKGINAQDVCTYLGSKNIYTLSGIFCAPYLRNIKKEYSYLRISLGIYNTFEDIDKLILELKNGGDFYAF